MIRPEVISLPRVFLGCKNHLWPIYLIHLFIHNIINVVVTFGVPTLSQQSLSSNVFSPLLMTGYFPSLIDNDQGGLFDQPSLTAHHPDPCYCTTNKTVLKTDYSTVTNKWRLAKMNFFRQLKATYATSTEEFVSVTWSFMDMASNTVEQGRDSVHAYIAVSSANCDSSDTKVDF